jgi:hypothetical protein
MSFYQHAANGADRVHRGRDSGERIWNIHEQYHDSYVADPTILHTSTNTMRVWHLRQGYPCRDKFRVRVRKD